MRNSHYMVPVLSCYWRSGDQPQRHIKLRDAEELLSPGDGSKPEYRRIGSRKGAFAIQALHPERADQRTQASITRGEMEANAEGCANPEARKLAKNSDGTPSETRLGNFVDVAMTKVEEWPFIGDTKAPRVSPGLRLAGSLAMLLCALLTSASGQIIDLTHHCGKERWAVKTSVPSNQQSAISANVRDLINTAHPDKATLLKHPRDRFPQELRTYTVTAYLAGYKLESDGDFHLVLRDPQVNDAEAPATMIAEIPLPACTHNRKLKKVFAQERAFIEQYGPATATLRRPNALLKFTGVFFFDFLHGQTGVAPNGAELHPLLAIADGLKGTDGQAKAAPRKRRH